MIPLSSQIEKLEARKLYRNDSLLFISEEGYVRKKTKREESTSETIIKLAENREGLKSQKLRRRQSGCTA